MTQETVETAIVKIKPETDITVNQFYQQALKAKNYAIARVIKTAEDLKPATDDLVLIRGVKKNMEAKRKEYLAPLKEYTDNINNAFKTLMTPIDEADKITTDKMLVFRAEQDRIHREQERINADKLELARREEALTGEHTVDLTPIVVTPLAPRKTDTELGSAGVRDNWKLIEVTDFTLLPDEYKIPDVVKLGKVIRAGLHNIPGCKIENQPGLVINTR